MIVKLNKTKAKAMYEILLSLNRGMGDTLVKSRVDFARYQIRQLEEVGIHFKEEPSEK